MQQPVQITVRNMRSSSSLKGSIREWSAKIEAHHPEILRWRVAVEADTARPRQGRRYRVSVSLHIRDREIVANQHLDEDLQVALREAFESVERQLREQVEVRREVRRRGLPSP